MNDKQNVARVLLTGAGSGFGRSIAVALAAQGYGLLLADRDSAGLDKTLSLIGEPKRVQISVTDLADEAARRDLVDRAESMLGGIDILINNAGVGGGPAKFWEASADDVQACMDVNGVAPLRLAMMTAPRMAERGWGRIINVTTSIGTMFMLAPYGGSKAANEAFIVKMASDLTGTGVTANAILPGGVAATSMGLKSGLSREHMLPPEVIVPPVLWLASRHSDNVTGRRFVASDWNADLPVQEAAEAASGPAGWPVTQAITQEALLRRP
ncbi:MAG: SDR family oxidoreductase [Rhizorhabdus sp.]|jgi:3-oxoacyl-[acyl-carrier protein] reductase|nr:MAG: SDR family oxidoreductase [Rhizorhabdus sp.]